MTWLNGWRRRQKICIDHRNIEENLINFPVKVIMPSTCDIFNNSNPSTVKDYLSYVNYYKAQGNTFAAKQYLDKAKEIDPKVHVDLKMPDQPVVAAKPTKTQAKPAAKPAAKTKETTKKEPVKETPKPVAEPKIEAETIKPEVTATTITMKNKMRYPLTRPDLMPAKPKKEIEVVEPIITEPVVEKEIIEELPQAVVEVEIPVEEPVKPQIVVQELDPTGKHDKLFLELFQSIETDSVKQEFIVGWLAYEIGADSKAIDYLCTIPTHSSYKSQANKILYDIYQRNGNDLEAKRLYAELSADSLNVQQIDFLDTPIKLWLGLLFSSILLVIGIVLTIFILQSRYKKQNTKITDEELAVHKKNLKTAYESKSPTTSTEEEIDLPSVPELSEIVTDYDDPQYIAEELSPEEENELEEDEGNYINIVQTDKKVIKATVDSGDDSFADEEYKKKMILKLYNDGWEIEEIAKELQLSQREIEFIIKMDE